MKRFFRRHSARTSKAAPIELKHHVLDLPRRLGSLELTYMDLPHHSGEERYYLRHTQRSRLPSSYRSGFAFFGMIMVLVMFGITALEAQTRAGSHRSILHTQLVESFSQLAEGLDEFRTTRSFDPPEVALSGTSLETFSNPLEQQAQLIRMNLQVKEGYQAFEDFIEDWKQPGDLLEKLRWMNASALKSLRVWNQVFAELQTFPLHDLDSGKKEQFYQSMVMMSDLRNFLQASVDFYEPLIKILGKDSPQRILIFIQDEHERRATGGALSAGVELLLDQGEVITQRAFHTADLDDQSRFSLPAPQELSELTEQWNLSTANAFLSFPKSAEQISWFWQREARNSPDLIVVLNSSVLDRLQEIAPLYESPLNAALHWSALRLKGDRQALKDFANRSLEGIARQLQNPEVFFQIWPLLLELRDQKQFMAMSFDQSLQARLESFDLDGALGPVRDHEDTLMISRVNQNANASDRWIYERFRIHTAITDEGIIRDWVQIERKHRWESDFLNPLLEKIGTSFPANLRPLLSTAPHRNVTRVLVPKGSRLLSVVGISMTDISTQDTESHTVWSFPQELSPGELATVELSYELPWTFDTQSVDNYRLNLLQQPGTIPVDLEHVLKLPTHLSVFQQLPEEPLTTLAKDERIAVVAGRNP
jgi:hypothetical protein